MNTAEEIVCALRDDLADTIRPRLDAAGVDVTLIDHLTSILDAIMDRGAPVMANRTHSRCSQPSGLELHSDVLLKSEPSDNGKDHDN